MWTFQQRVGIWMLSCFNTTIVKDKVERNYRFLEEALELVQSLGCSKDDALKLVDYVYGRDVGNPTQEVGGVTVTLAALCNANGLSVDECAELGLEYCWQNLEKIREKQKKKPISSPLAM